MQGNNNMAQKASKVYKKEKKKNGQIFWPKMFGLPLYLRNAAPSTPIKRGSNGQAYEMREKGKKKKKSGKGVCVCVCGWGVGGGGGGGGGRERQKGREKMRDQIAKKYLKFTYLGTMQFSVPLSEVSPTGDLWGRRFDPRRVWQHSFVEIDHEIFSIVILYPPLIQDGQLSVSGERMCTCIG